MSGWDEIGQRECKQRVRQVPPNEQAVREYALNVREALVARGWTGIDGDEFVEGLTTLVCLAGRVTALVESIEYLNGFGDLDLQEEAAK